MAGQPVAQSPATSFAEAFKFEGQVILVTAFVTGIAVPGDRGISAYAGV
jgi:hypothetical protein